MKDEENKMQSAAPEQQAQPEQLPRQLRPGGEQDLLPAGN